jgi:hypothetical protein
MAIIVVGGSSRGVGKTALVCGLIAALSEYRWSAVKITTDVHSKPKPIWEETSAGKGTDTARYLAAGAERAFLATAAMSMRERRLEPDLPPVLDELWPNFGPGTNLIFESNSILRHLQPTLCLLVQGAADDATRKPSFTAALGLADALVVHAPLNRFIPDGFCRVGEQPKPIFSLAAVEQISQEMLFWLRDRLHGRALL